MLLGKAIIEEAELGRHIASKEEFYLWCDNMIPEEFRHVKEIRDNQRYLCTLILRKSDKVAWDKKKDLIISILTETRVTGLTDSCIEVSQLSDYIGRPLMEKYLRRMNKQ